MVGLYGSAAGLRACLPSSYLLLTAILLFEPVGCNFQYTDTPTLYFRNSPRLTDYVLHMTKPLSESKSKDGTPAVLSKNHLTDIIFNIEYLVSLESEEHSEYNDVANNTQLQP